MSDTLYIWLMYCWLFKKSSDISITTEFVDSNNSRDTRIVLTTCPEGAVCARSACRTLSIVGEQREPSCSVFFTDFDEEAVCDWVWVIRGLTRGCGGEESWDFCCFGCLRTLTTQKIMQFTHWKLTLPHRPYLPASGCQYTGTCWVC